MSGPGCPPPPSPAPLLARRRCTTRSSPRHLHARAHTRTPHTLTHTDHAARPGVGPQHPLAPGHVPIRITSLSASHPYAHHVPVRITSLSAPRPYPHHVIPRPCHVPFPARPCTYSHPRSESSIRVIDLSHRSEALIRVIDPSHLSESPIRVTNPSHAVGRPANQAAGCRLRLSPPRRPAAGPPAAPPLIRYSPLCRARANSARTAVQYTQPLMSNFCC